jgi:hypothetical protein
VLAKIASIDSRKQREYYELLYCSIIDHFLAYRITSTGFFSENTRSFTGGDNAIKTLLTAQPIVHKIPVLGSIIAVPFDIMAKYRKVKTSYLNHLIAKKIGSSNFKTESEITEYMAYAIDRLVDNKQFNAELMHAIKEEQESYIKRLFDL